MFSKLNISGIPRSIELAVRVFIFVSGGGGFNKHQTWKKILDFKFIFSKENEYFFAIDYFFGGFIVLK